MIARNNIPYKMTHILNVDDVFTYTENSNEQCCVYFDLDSASKLLNVAPLLYKNVPSLRPKIIQASKSYKLTKSVYDLLDSVNNGYRNSKNIEKIYVISEDTNVVDYIKANDMNIAVVNSDQFYKTCCEENNKPILFVDVNENKIKKINSKKNMHVMLLQLVK